MCVPLGLFVGWLIPRGQMVSHLLLSSTLRSISLKQYVSFLSCTPCSHTKKCYLSLILK